MKTDLSVQYQIGSYHEEVNIYITPHSSMCLNAVSGIPIWFMGHELVTFLTLPGESPEAGVSLQYIHRIYVYIPTWWKNLRSMKVKRKQLNYVCSYFTNWLWLFSPYKLPAHWVSKIAALVYWFREWMEEKRESKRKTLNSFNNEKSRKMN